MITGNDFILNPNKLENHFQLVEVTEWKEFNTKEKLGYYYSVVLPKLKFEKVRVAIKSAHPFISSEELEQKGQISVEFEGLHTWASLYNGRLSAKAEASAIKKAGLK